MLLCIWGNAAPVEAERIKQGEAACDEINEFERAMSQYGTAAQKTRVCVLYQTAHFLLNIKSKLKNTLSYKVKILI